MHASANRTWIDHVRVVFGGLYLAAGIAKAFPEVENIGTVLQLMAEANAGTILAPLSDLIAAKSGPITVLVGLALAGSGLAFLTGRLLVPAAIGQLAMLLGFMTLLFRYQPAIIAIDLPFFVVSILVLRRECAHRKGNDSNSASNSEGRAS